MLAVHDLDDPARIESIVRGFHFDSWQSVEDFVAGYGLDNEVVARELQRTVLLFQNLNRPTCA